MSEDISSRLSIKLKKEEEEFRNTDYLVVKETYKKKETISNCIWRNITFIKGEEESNASKSLQMRERERERCE